MSRGANVSASVAAAKRYAMAVALETERSASKVDRVDEVVDHDALNRPAE